MINVESADDSFSGPHRKSEHHLQRLRDKDIPSMQTDKIRRQRKDHQTKKKKVPIQSKQ